MKTTNAITILLLVSVIHNVAGDWTEWSAWTVCTQTCGIGVSSSYRDCNDTIEKSECTGNHIRHRTCNVMDCDSEGPNDFRAAQCAEYNDILHSGKLYQWIPETGSHLPPCALFCRANGTEIVEMKTSKVLDGTRCSEASYDVCINGNCEDVGCDRNLYSRKREDACGVCEGDGTSCRLITGLHRPDPSKNIGSEVVITIPQNSRHITVSERGSGHVGLKLQDSPQLDVVMPNITETFIHGVVSSSGLVVNYGKLSYEKEYFDVLGPVPENVQVMALYNNAVWKYIRYEFYRPLVASWIHNETSFECTKTCGNGLRFIWPICVDAVSGEKTSKKACEDEGLSPPAPKVFRCNTDPCPDSYLEERHDFSFEILRGPRWVADPWTKCSASCGVGYQTRTLSCMEDSDDGGSFESVDDKPCDDAGHVRPETKRQCNQHPCPRWKVMAWSRCSVTCGIGFQHRPIQCLSHDGSPGFNCDETEKPKTTQSCEMPDKCRKKAIVRVPLFPVQSGSESSAFSSTITSVSFDPSWVPDFWGACSVSCGSGVTKRAVRCQKILKFSKTIATLPDSQCNSEKKPAETQTCSRGDCFNARLLKIGVLTAPCSGKQNCLTSPQGDAGRWELGPFSPCTTTCGRGTQTRTVTCREIPEGSNQTAIYESNPNPLSTTMPEMMCPSPKPRVTRDCSQSSCPPQWKAGGWSKCSRPCGRGIRTRFIRCTQKLGSGKTVSVPPGYCTQKQPSRKRICIQKHRCPPNYEAGPWRPCRSNCDSSRAVNTQTRVVRCLQHQAGKLRPKRRGHRRCSNLRRPPSVRNCRKHDCNRRVRPQIRTSRRNFIQSQPQSKIHLIIGQQAAVLPNTNVFIRCSVTSFPSSRIRWYFNGTLLGTGAKRISKARNHVAILQSGRLKIHHVSSRDSGFYACAAGTSFARTNIKVISSTSADYNQTPSLSSLNNVHPTLSYNPTPSINNAVSNDFDAFNQLLHRQQDSSTPPDLPHLDQSVVHVQRIATDDESEDRLSLNNYETTSTSSSSAFDNVRLISKIREFRNENHGQVITEEISNKLQKILTITSSFKRGETSKQDYIQHTNNIKQYLTRFLNENEDVSHNNTISRDIESVRSIQNLIEAQFINTTEIPRIAVFPTKSPIYREFDVTTYVGGSLMITQAKRITILCETLGTVQSQITWYRDEKELRSNHRFFVLREGSLRILNPQFEDDGVYTCVASNRYGNDSKSSILTVMRKPRIRSITTTHRDYSSDVVDVVIGSDIRAKLGAKVIIRCPSDGFPDSLVVWSKDGPGLGKNAKFLADNSLQLSPATAADQGLFACEARNPAGSDYQASSLVLLDPPRLSNEANFFSRMENEAGLPGVLRTGRTLETYRIRANASVLIGCPVTGYPEPHVTWLFNNQSLHSLGHVLDYQLLEHDRVLQIPDFGLETRGVYTCHARNEAGNLTSSLNLKLSTCTYVYGELSTCSASCGNSGIQTKQGICIQDGTNEVDNWYCNGQTKLPTITIPCNQVNCPPRLIYGEWSACSTTCGAGEKVRSLSCVTSLLSGLSQEVAIEQCSRHLTLETEPCKEQECSHWKSGAWSSCSRKCFKRGFAAKFRQIHCVGTNGTKVDSSLCLNFPKPKRIAPCRSRRCMPVWVVSRWSSCSSTCGSTGVQTRGVKCVYRGNRHQAAIRQCSRRSQPKSKLPCNRKACSSSIPDICTDRFLWCKKLKQSQCTRARRRVCCQSCQR